MDASQAPGIVLQLVRARKMALAGEITDLRREIERLTDAEAVLTKLQPPAETLPTPPTPPGGPSALAT